MRSDKQILLTDKDNDDGDDDDNYDAGMQIL